MNQTSNQLKPYYILSNITLFSDLPMDELLELIATSLNIPKFHLDESGDYDDEIVYLSDCLGFQIFFAKDEEDLDRYHLSVNTARGVFDLGKVTAKNLNWDDSLLALLQKACPSLEVRERRPEDEPDI